MNPDLNAARRSADLGELAAGELVDVLVIGGGVTGAGVALDAASRGLKVALVERDDLASGTSRWSSKLIHGGLRYLATGQVQVAYESAQERAHLMNKIAPHLVHRLAQVMPIYDWTKKSDVALNGAGLGAGHVLKMFARTGKALRPPHWVGAEAALELAPGLKREGLRGALVSYDGQVEDDARLVIAIARTAAAYGARIVTRCEVDRVTAGGAEVTDRLTGASFQIRAKNIINATGVWADELDTTIKLVPSRGTHVVVPSAVLGEPKAAILAAVPGELGRYVFALPQPDGVSYVGITDVEETARPVPRVPEPTAEEIAWILSVLSRVVDREVLPSDAVGAFAGLRPLVAPAAAGDSTADISRGHLVKRTGNLITVTGGKMTTYRRMAEEAVDHVTGLACITGELPLIGVGPVAATAPERLRRRYGVEAHRIMQLAQGDKTLLAPIADGIPVLGVEVVHAVLHEGALGVDDVLERRTRLSLVPSQAEKAKPRVAEIISATRG
ncbi:MAG TPA: glycerol-3-phosphate dehydrogenase/oxidase [Aeromicrobium sp.]|nr:glycerol-3-phosphate dehydrogenase/oxidase [Aeromicrobium sp.]